jgi:hypothetical protein
LSKNLQSAGTSSGDASLRPRILLVEVLGFGNCEDGATNCK